MSEPDLFEVEGSRVLIRVHLMMTNISEILLDENYMMVKDISSTHVPGHCSPRRRTMD
jgi:hypothetical protein